MLGLIGERGREAIIPLDRIHEVLNLDNNSAVFIAENRISGQDIVTAFKRADKHNKRTY
jgi:phage-related minor tail protein